MTGAKVSLKSNPAIWENPLMTIRALYFSNCPFASRLILKTHLRGITFLPGGNLESTQVLFLMIAEISSQHAFHQAVLSELVSASSREIGSA